MSKKKKPKGINFVAPVTLKRQAKKSTTRKETVEEFLARGGKVEKLEEEPAIASESVSVPLYGGQGSGHVAQRSSRISRETSQDFLGILC